MAKVSSIKSLKRREKPRILLEREKSVWRRRVGRRKWEIITFFFSIRTKRRENIMTKGVVFTYVIRIWIYKVL